jgi:hypothetical protein
MQRLMDCTQLPTQPIDLPFCWTIQVMYGSTVITSGLPQKIQANIHYALLQEKIQRDKGWSSETFHSVD